MAWDMYGVRPVSHARCGMMACMDVARLQPVCTCVPTRQSLLPPGRFWAQTLFLPFIAPVSKGYEGRQLLRRRRQCTTPSQPNIQLSFISSFVYFGACVLPGPSPTSKPDRDVHIHPPTAQRGGTGQDTPQAGQPYDHDDDDPDVTTEMPHQPNPPSPSPCRQVKRGLHRAPALSHLLCCTAISFVVSCLGCARDLFGNNAVDPREDQIPSNIGTRMRRRPPAPPPPPPKPKPRSLYLVRS